MQTLGVALPWAIAAGLLYPNKKTLSISGDGGFLFSAMELETAVSLKSPIVHVVWNDSSYNMVAFQQEMKYGRDSAVHLGQVDIKKCRILWSGRYESYNKRRTCEMFRRSI